MPTERRKRNRKVEERDEAVPAGRGALERPPSSPGDRGLGRAVPGRWVAHRQLPQRRADHPGQLRQQPRLQKAQTLLEQRLTGPRRSNEVVIVRSDAKPVTDPAFKAYV